MRKFTQQVFMKYLLFIIFIQVCIPAGAQEVDTSFHTYLETIPHSPVSFYMIAIPAGSFLMGGWEKKMRRTVIRMRDLL